MKNLLCRNCNEVTPHLHQHDAAYGISNAHLTGTERFTCTTCCTVTFSTNYGAAAYPFIFDKPAVAA